MPSNDGFEDAELFHSGLATVNYIDDEDRVSIEEENKSEAAPIDKLYLVYIVVVLNGIGVLLPWNMFITIAPQYYVDYWFTYKNVTSNYGKEFMTDLGIISQIPNFLLAVLSTASIIKGALFIKIGSSLIINCILIAIVLGFSIFAIPSENAQGWFFGVNLAIVLLMNASNGFYQNSMFGLAADFPFAYTNAVIVGSNLCGTFTSVLSIIATLVFGTNYKAIAIAYFSISLAVLIICGFSIVIMTRTPFYKYYAGKGETARMLKGSTRPSLRQYWEAFTYSWQHYLNVFLVYFVSLAVFPTVLVGTVTNLSESLKGTYIGLTVFLNFNLFALIGSTTAGFIRIPPPKLLFIPVFLRLLFIPFFMLCHYDSDARVMPVVFESPWWMIIGNAVLSFTSGYFSSLGMMYAPGSAPPELQKIAGQCAGLALVAGIMGGVAFTPVITSMVEHIH